MIKSRNRKISGLLPVIFVFTFISGISAGSLFARLSAEGLVITGMQISSFPTFCRSFSSFLKPCFLIWIFGFTGISEYISAGILAYRGSLFGFVNTCLFGKLGFSAGLKASLAASLPHNLVFFPFMFFLSLAAAGKRKSSNTVSYIVILSLSILVSAFSAVIDTYITSHFINQLF